MEKNISPVDWLVEELKKQSIDLTKWHNDLVEQANILFQEQIQNAYNEGTYLALTPSYSALDYFNETYKTK